MTTKKCGKCGAVKPIEDFTKHKKTFDGRQYWCRPCYRIYQAERHGRMFGAKREAARSGFAGF
jgi:hypothetical protein